MAQACIGSRLTSSTPELLKRVRDVNFATLITVIAFIATGHRQHCQHIDHDQDDIDEDFHGAASSTALP